jgi:hypothetical protein
MFGSIREPQEIEHRRTARVLKTNSRQIRALQTATAHVLDTKPNRTKENRKDILRPQQPSPNRHAQTRQF